MGSEDSRVGWFCDRLVTRARGRRGWPSRQVAAVGSVRPADRFGPLVSCGACSSRKPDWRAQFLGRRRWIPKISSRRSTAVCTKQNGRAKSRNSVTKAPHLLRPSLGKKKKQKKETI